MDLGVGSGCSSLWSVHLCRLGLYATPISVFAAVLTPSVVVVGPHLSADDVVILEQVGLLTQRCQRYLTSKVLDNQELAAIAVDSLL